MTRGTKKKVVKAKAPAKKRRASKVRAEALPRADVERLLRDGVSVADYAKALGISRQGAISRLETAQKRGLVERVIVSAADTASNEMDALFTANPPKHGKTPTYLYRLAPIARVAVSTPPAPALNGAGEADGLVPGDGQAYTRA
jgi:hypothetical protein